MTGAGDLSDGGVGKEPGSAPGAGRDGQQEERKEQCRAWHTAGA